MRVAAASAVLFALAACWDSHDTGVDGSTPMCALPVYDSAAFGARCAAGTELPVALGSAPGAVAFDGTQFGVLGGPWSSASLRTFDLEGAPVGEVDAPGSLALVAFDCGFAVDSASADGTHWTLRIFDHDLVERGAHGALQPDGFLLWDGSRFASMRAYPSPSGNYVTFLDRDGAVVSSGVGEWVFSATGAAWDGSQYIVAGIGGPPGEVLSGLDRDGHRVWVSGGEASPGFGTRLVPTPDGFLEEVAAQVTPRSHTGVPLGPARDLVSVLGLAGATTPVALGSGGGEVRAVFVVAAADGSTSLETVTLDATLNPVGSPQTVAGASPVATAPLTLIWAGYSFAAFFEPASASGTLSMVRICP